MTRPSVTNSGTASGNNLINHDITLTISSGSGRVLLAMPSGVDNAQNVTVSSCTFDPGGSDEASFTQVTGAESLYDVSGVRHITDVWWLALSDGVSSGDYTVRCTFSEGVFRGGSKAWEVADADTTDPIGGVASTSGNTDTPTVTVSAEESTSLVTMHCTVREEVTFTAGSGDTEVTDVFYNLASHWSGHTNGTGGSDTCSCITSDTPTGDTWVVSGVEILEAAAGGANAPTGNISGPLVGPLGGPI